MRRASRQGGIRVWRVLGVALLGAVVLVLMLAFNTLARVIVAPLCAGIVVTLLSSRRAEASASALFGGLLGTAVSAWAFTDARISAMLEALPEYARVDVTQDFYMETLTSILRSHPVHSPLGTGLTATLALLVPLGVVFLTGRIAARVNGGGPVVRRWMTYAAIALAMTSFVFTAWHATTYYRDLVRFEPDAGYSSDMIIMLKIHFLMGQGQDYYEAMVNAAALDARLSAEGAVEEGRFVGSWVYGFHRQPWLFHLWRLVSPRDGVGIVLLSIVLSACLLPLLFWGFSARYSYGAVLMPLVVFPYLLLGTTWWNLLHADWWGTLFVLASMAFALRNQVVPAALFALAAAMSREVLVLWLAILLVLAVLQWRRNREWLPIGSIAGAALAFAAAYAIHLRADARTVATDTSGAAGSLAGSAAARSLVDKLVAPTSYLMLPYGFPVMPGLVVAAVGLVGFASFARKRDVWSLAPLLYLSAWLTYYAVFGASSSYWGQEVMPFAVLGCAVLALEFLARTQEASRGAALA